MSVAATEVIGARRVRAERLVPALAAVLGLVLVAATVEVIVDASTGHTGAVPVQPSIAGWMSGLGEKLGSRVFLIALLASCGAYAGLLVLARAAPAALRGRRAAIGLVAALHAIVFAGPILLSTDVFSYIAYARMGVEHGLNPYIHGPASISHDPVFYYVGHVWRHTDTAYGPFYTLLSYPFAPLGLKGALWGMKALALVSSAGTLWLVWRCARARGLDPAFALLAVGANPLYVLYGLGGAHNDLQMMLLMMVAVALTIGPAPGARREAGAAAIVVAGALVKATVAVLLPFMIIARRRLAPVLGAAAMIAVGALIAYGAFGVHGIDVVSALNRDAALVSSDSFANMIAHLFGKPGVFPVDHDLLKAALVIVTLHFAWRTWRGYDWVAASGWVLLAISVTSTWLLAWYILWPLPLAVISRDRRLLYATLAVQSLFVIHQLDSLFVPVQ